MSRIRSIHPGFFTDEDLVSVSMGARLLFLGLGVEADDKGVFVWKPLTIKMMVFPGDNIDVAAMLAELEEAGAIRQYEIGGKMFGAIRNFRKFQKPKTPNDIHPATAEILAFVGLVSETNDNQETPFPQNGETFPQNGEIVRQMEEGGGRGRGKREKAYAFCGRVVRLTQKDFDEFKAQFHTIPDLPAELAAFDGWVAGQSEAKQSKWFGSLAPWLNKRHQEAVERSKPAAQAAFSGPC